MVHRGGRYGLWTASLSRLSGYRCHAVWQAAPWRTALSVSQRELAAAHFSLTRPEPRRPPCGETTDGGHGLAYVFGAREDHVFWERQALLEPLGITRFDTDGWGAYRRHIDHDKHTVGKHHPQKIERQHTTLRARIKRVVRKAICFAQSM